MAGPLVVSFTMRGAFTFVDTAYAAILGDASVAAIGLTVPFEFLMIALWVGMSTGLTSTISRAMGSRESEKIDQYLKAGWRLVWITSPVFALVGAAIWFFSPRLGLDEDVYTAFRIYGTVLIGGSAITSFWSVIPDSVIKAHQDTRTTMWAGIISNVINVTLNTVFLFVFHWGIFGIAFSTVLSRVGSLVYALYKAKAHEERRRASGEPPVPGRDPHPTRAILALAVPSSITFALMAGEVAIVNAMLALTAHPTESIAAYSIFHRVMLLALNPVIAGGVALLPFSAMRFGEGDEEGVRRGLRQVGVASIIYSVAVVAPVLLSIAHWLARRLAESPLTMEYTTFALRLTPLAVLAASPFLLCRPVFEGMNRGRPGVVMAVFRYLLLMLPGAWFGMEAAVALGRPGFEGLVAGLLVVSVATSVVFLVWLRRALTVHFARPNG